MYDLEKPEIKLLRMRVNWAYEGKNYERGINVKDSAQISELIKKSLLGALIGLSNKNKYPRAVPKKLIPSQTPTLIIH